MDNLQFNNFKRQKNNFKMFLTLLDSYEKAFEEQNEEKMEEMLRLLKSQQTTNQFILEELGLKFDNTGKIRELNEQIRELEEKIAEDSDLNLSEVCHYLDSLSKKINKDLERKYGISTNLRMKACSSISVEFGYINAVDYLSPRDSQYYRTEESFNERQAEIHEAVNNFEKLGLDCSEDSDIYYTEENLAILRDIIEKEFSQYGEIINFNFDITFFKQKVKRGAKDLYIFRNLSFVISTLASHKNLRGLFSS